MGDRSIYSSVFNIAIKLLSLKNNKREYHESSASSSSSDSSGSSPYDEGEMRSSDESEFSKDEQSSEEGEVQSEIDEVIVWLTLRLFLHRPFPMLFFLFSTMTS